MKRGSYSKIVTLRELVPSVPSMSVRMQLRKNEGENNVATDKPTDEDQKNAATKKMEWKEKGIGAVRILWNH